MTPRHVSRPKRSKTQARPGRHTASGCPGRRRERSELGHTAPKSAMAVWGSRVKWFCGLKPQTRLQPCYIAPLDQSPADGLRGTSQLLELPRDPTRPWCGIPLQVGLAEGVCTQHTRPQRSPPLTGSHADPPTEPPNQRWLAPSSAGVESRGFVALGQRLVCSHAGFGVRSGFHAIFPANES